METKINDTNKGERKRLAIIFQMEDVGENREAIRVHASFDRENENKV